jgi:hypothetical protein
MRALLAGTVLLAACYTPSLSGAPFSCPDGACPDGYRCEQGLCLAPDQPTPPILIATTTAESAPPQVVFDGASFAVFWHETIGAVGGPEAGIHLTTVAAAGTQVDQLLSGAGFDLSFSTLFLENVRRHVVALTSNNVESAQLSVYTLPVGGGPSLLYMLQQPTSAIGYSAPSLSAAGGNAVVLAYTFAAPPLVDADNVFCAHIRVDTGEVDPSCRPSAAATAGRFVAEVTVAESLNVTTLFWRSGGMHLSRFVAGIEQAVIDVQDLVRIPRAVYHADKLALVGELPSGPDSAQWVIVSGDLDRGQRRGIASLNLTPDLISDGSGFVSCVRQAGGASDGELAVQQFSANLEPVGDPQIVPRISRAEIGSCRLVAGVDTIGVVWQEHVPPASARIYLALVPRPKS